MALTNDIRNVVQSAAAAHQLPFAYVAAVCEQESGWEPYVIRYEPAFYERYVAPQGHEPTEAIARSISWGLMQLMGQVARELGFTGHLASLSVPAIGLEYGCRKLAQCLAQAGEDWTKALLRWNGGGNPDYAAQVLARIKNYT